MRETVNRFGGSARRSSHAFAAVCLVCLILAPSPASALDISAELDRQTAQVGDQVVLTVNVQGGARSVPEPELPELSQNFEVYSSGSSRSFSLVGGTMSASLTLRYVLVPRREGTFTIGAISVQSGKETAKTEPLTLQVVKGAPPPSPPAGGTRKGPPWGAKISSRGRLSTTSPLTSTSR